MNVFITNDVEHTGMNGHTWNRIAQQVDKIALPRLLDMYDKYNVKATFFVLGQLAELKPNIVKQIVAHNQEVGSHGYQHNRARAFDVMSLNEQIAELRKSKDILEQICGAEVVSFRAPALRVNQYTPDALQEVGFKFDSSIAPQRLDAFMSYGTKGKWQWMRAPRTIYKTKHNNLARSGNGKIIEVPISAYGAPYIGTLMRIAPNTLLPITRSLLFYESQRKGTPITFLFHPNEAICEIEEEVATNSMGTLGIKHFFADTLRAKLKQKHLDLSAFDLLEKELLFWQHHNAEFVQIKQAIPEN